MTAARTRRDWQRWARKGTTTSRGYGHAHQAERERRLRQYKPGDPCAHCGQPMTWWPLTVARRYIDLPHTPTATGYLPGLAHRVLQPQGRAAGSHHRQVRHASTGVAAGTAVVSPAE